MSTHHTPVPFADLGVAPRVVAALRERGIDAPFPIQAATLPDSLAGRDVLGRGRTGSGKTVAFALPDRRRARRLAAARARPHRPRALVLVPDPRARHPGRRDHRRPLAAAVGAAHA